MSIVFFILLALSAPAENTTDLCSSSLTQSRGSQGPLAGLEPLACFGTEPFWGLKISADGGAEFHLAGERSGIPMQVTSFSTSRNDLSAREARLSARAGRDMFTAWIVGSTCNDGMSDFEHPFAIYFSSPLGPLSGCCKSLR